MLLRNMKNETNWQVVRAQGMVNPCTLLKAFLPYVDRA
jgi:hypothetical protein